MESLILSAMLTDLESDESFDRSVLARVRDLVSVGNLTNVDVVKRTIYGDAGAVDEDS